MRLALLILALMATPVFARDGQPDPPDYEKPEFEKPTTPEPPEPPDPTNPPEATGGGGNEDFFEPPVVVAPLPEVTEPDLRCYFDKDGVRTVSFNPLVDPEFYKMGSKFCAKVPSSVTDVSVRCIENNGKYQVQFSQELHSAEAVKRGQAFCICVFGLD